MNGPTRSLLTCKKVKAFDPASVDVPDDLRLVAEQLVTIPNIASKRWISVQYDSTVGTANSSTNQPSDAAVVLVKITERSEGYERNRAQAKVRNEEERSLTKF